MHRHKIHLRYCMSRLNGMQILFDIHLHLNLEFSNIQILVILFFTHLNLSQVCLLIRAVEPISTISKVAKAGKKPVCQSRHIYQLTSTVKSISTISRITRTRIRSVRVVACRVRMAWRIRFAFTQI